MKKLLRKLLGRERRARSDAPYQGFDREAFEIRLRGMAMDDPLWPQLTGLLEAYLLREAEAAAVAGVSDGEAHRARGRIGMLLDLKSDLEKAWEETHPRKRAE